MKFRAHHAVILILIFLTAFMFYAVSRSRTARESTDGAVPGMGEDPESAPSIYMESTYIDMGTIPGDSVAKKVVKVFNKGKRELKIYGINSSCACTRGEIHETKMNVPPGGSAEMTVSVFPSRIYGFRSLKTLTIASNSLNDPSLSIDVEASVEPEFSLTPEHLEFGEVRKGEAVSETILLRQLTEARITLQELKFAIGDEEEMPHEDLQATFEQVPEEDWENKGKAEYRIHVVPAPDLAPGEFERAMYIVTDVPRFPYYRMRVAGNVVAPYTMESEERLGTIYFTAETEESEIRIQGAPGIRVTDLVAPDELAVSVDTDHTDENAVITIQMADGLVSGRHDGEIRYNVLVGSTTYAERVKVRIYIRGR